MKTLLRSYMLSFLNALDGQRYPLPHCSIFVVFFFRVSGAAAPEGQMTYGSTQGDFRFSGSPFLRFSVSPVFRTPLPLFPPSPPPPPPPKGEGGRGGRGWEGEGGTKNRRTGETEKRRTGEPENRRTKNHPVWIHRSSAPPGPLPHLL